MLTYLGFGHSHVVALANGAHILTVKGTPFGGVPVTGQFHYLYANRFEPPLLDGTTGTRLNPAILDLIQTGQPRCLVSSIGGNEHNVLSITQGARRYDFILGENPDLPLDTTGEIIPEAAIRENLTEWTADKIALLRAIRGASALPLVQIEPPPPLPRDHVLACRKDAFRRTVNARNLSPDSVRHKMWRVQTGLYRKACADLGVHYIQTLPDMIDEHGMLARGAWGKDATHANDNYGEAMMAEAFRCVVAQAVSAG